MGISSEDLKHALEGLTVTASCRHGKYFWLEFGPGSSSLLLHFGEGQVDSCMTIPSTSSVREFKVASKCCPPGMNGILSVRTPNGTVVAPEYAR